MSKAVLRTSLLRERHEKAGAHFTEFAGWKVVNDYGNPEEECLAVRKAVGLADLSYRGKILVTGEDRSNFLHSMLTHDVKKMKKGEGLYAMMLNAQARILADLYLFNFSDHFLIDSSPLVTQKIVPTLEKYIIMEKVSLKDATDSFSFFALEGPQSRDFLSKLADADWYALKPLRHARALLRGIETEIFSTSFAGETGFALLASAKDAESLWNLLAEEGRDVGVTPFGLAALQILRIEAGIPWYGMDMDETNLFPEIGLEHAVSYTKGCYIGQEVVARLQTYAQVNKKLLGLEIISGDLPPSRARISKEGKEVGYLTSAVYSPLLNKKVALGYLARNAAVAGTEVEIDSETGKSKACIVSLPFLRKG